MLGRSNRGLRKLQRKLAKDPSVEMQLEAPGGEEVTEEEYLQLISEQDLAGLEAACCRDLQRSYRLVDKLGQSLMHAAAKVGWAGAIKLLSVLELDVDLQDKVGSTPLHAAVECDQPAAVSALVSLGANPNLFTRRIRMTPVHLAAELNHHRCLAELLTSPRLDPNVTGHRGCLPVHFACARDSVECLQLLMEHNMCPSKPEETGLYPIHLAVASCGFRAVPLMAQLFMDGAATSAKELINIRDLEGNVPLHAAISSGDLRMVELCIRLGADVDCVQEDGSTPVHFACTKGELALLEVMFQLQEGKAMRVLAVTDKNGHTPLHKAAMFDHAKLVTWLIQKGASRDAVDNQRMTPLLIAAQKNSTSAMKALLLTGSSVQVEDEQQRNILHLIVLSGGSGSLGYLHQERGQEISVLINKRDHSGSTPLHYAAKRGDLRFMHLFLAAGAVCNVSNNEKKSPIHYAATYGRLKTCRNIIELHPSEMNNKDVVGYTPLHLASMYGHVRIVAYLLSKGSPFHRGFCGKTPVHAAAEFGHAEILKLLVSVNKSSINALTKCKKTPLHYAAEQGHTDAMLYLLSENAQLLHDNYGDAFINCAIAKGQVAIVKACIAHNRWKEIMHSNYSNKWPVLETIRHMPECTEALLNRCVEEASGKKVYDFCMLQANPAYIQDIEAQMGAKYEFLPTVQLMVRLQRTSLLIHPVVENYLQMKWRQYGSWIHNFSMAMYIIFLTLLSTFVANGGARHPGRTGLCSAGQKRSDAKSWGCFIAPAFVAAFCLANCVKELVQLYHQRLRYLSDAVNYLENSLYLVTLAFVMPYLLGLNQSYQQATGSVAIFLAWFNFLLFFQRYEMFGLYVIMFTEILQTLIRVLILFSILVVGFGLSFYILLQYDPTPTASKELQNPQETAHLNSSSNSSSQLGLPPTARPNRVGTGDPEWSQGRDTALDAWSQPSLAFLKTALMMLGEYDYLNTFVTKVFDEDWRTVNYPTVTLGMLAVFITLMPILLVNLLIGLAVGDIEQIQRHATLTRIARQVQWYAELEGKMPRRLLIMVDRMSSQECGNCCVDPLADKLHSMFKRCAEAFLRLKTSLTRWKQLPAGSAPTVASAAAAAAVLAAGGHVDEIEKRLQKMQLLEEVQRSSLQAELNLNRRCLKELRNHQGRLAHIESVCQYQTGMLRRLLLHHGLQEEEEKDEGLDCEDGSIPCGGNV